MILADWKFWAVAFTVLAFAYLLGRMHGFVSGGIVPTARLEAFHNLADAHLCALETAAGMIKAQGSSTHASLIASLAATYRKYYRIPEE